MESRYPKCHAEGMYLVLQYSVILMNCRQEALAAFEELFLYACPKFITANPPPYEDPAAIAMILAPTSPTESPPQTSTPQVDPTHRHLNLFLADVAAHAPVPTLRSFLKLYTSLGAKKLANFLDADEEEMVQELMMMKQSSRQINHISGNEKGLLDGQVISTTDLDFVIDEVCVVLCTLRTRKLIRQLEHGTYCGVYSWQALRLVVHQKHGEGTANLR